MTIPQAADIVLGLQKSTAAQYEQARRILQQSRRGEYCFNPDGKLIAYRQP